MKAPGGGDAAPLTRTTQHHRHPVRSSFAALAVVAGGFFLNRRERYAVLAQTLCATGVVVLYGVTYAAHAYYHLALLARPIAAFGLMALITAGAFLRA